MKALMNTKQKQEFILLASLLQMCQDITVEFNQDEAELIKQACGSLRKALDSYSEKCAKTLLKEILTELKTSEVAVIKNDIKTKRTNVVSVKKESLYVLAEQAMLWCNPCSRNPKACVLRKAFLELGIPQLEEGQPKCPYMLTKENDK
jgi:Zn-dependent M32 family carboxypeptidase